MHCTYLLGVLLPLSFALFHLAALLLLPLLLLSLTHYRKRHNLSFLILFSSLVMVNKVNKKIQTNVCKCMPHKTHISSPARRRPIAG